MNVDPNNVDLLTEITFKNDIKGPAQFVYWREVPVGVVRPLKRIPNLSKLPPETRKEVREKYKQRLGKWYDPWGFAGGNWFDTKEEAAREVVLKALASPDKPACLEAAIRGDYAEVKRLNEELRNSITFEDEV